MYSFTDTYLILLTYYTQVTGASSETLIT